MTKADRIIADLINALDAIERAHNLEFAQGVAEQARKMAIIGMARNSDGYLVVKGA